MMTIGFSVHCHFRVSLRKPKTRVNFICPVESPVTATRLKFADCLFLLLI